MKIRKGDTVKVIAGKDRGVTGKVINAFPKTSTVVVEGANIAQRHQRARKSGQSGQIIDKAMPIHISNVQLLDPKDNKPTRIGYKIKESKKAGLPAGKVRVAKRSGTELSS